MVTYVDDNLVIFLLGNYFINETQLPALFLLI